MDRLRGLGDSAVVDLDLLRYSFKENAGGDGGVGSDVDSLGGGEGAGADRDGNIDGHLAGVVDLYGDQRADALAVTSRHVSRGDIDDGEVGEAAVVVDPVVEDAGQVFAGGGFEDALKA